MFCRNCGKEIREGSKFCTGCGTPVPAPAAPTAPVEETPAVPETPVEEIPTVPETPVEAPAAPVEETPAVPETPVEAPAAPVEAPAAVAVEEPAAPDAEEPAPAKKKKGKGKVIAIIAVCVALVGALGVGGFFLAQRMGLFGGGNGSDRAPAYVYLTGDGRLMYLPDLKEGTQALELTDDLDGDVEQYSLFSTYYFYLRQAVQFSKDGKSVYFLGERDASGDNADLYCATLSQLKRGEKPRRILRDVCDYQLLDGGKVVFMRLDGGSVLNLYDGREEHVLARDPYFSRYVLTEDERYIYYAEPYGSGYAIYRVTVATGEKEKLGPENISAIIDYDVEAQVLLYAEDEGYDEEGNNRTIYYATPDQPAQKVAEGVYGVFNLRTDEGIQLDYTVQHIQERTAYDLVNDPDSEEGWEEPNSWEYEIYDIYYLDDGNWYYEDYLDDAWHLIDVSDLLTYGAEAWELEDWEVWQYVSEKLQEEYQAKQEAWQLRQALRNWDCTLTTYDLYHYADGESTLVAADVTDYEDEIFLYKKAPDQGRMVDLADLTMDNFYEVIDQAQGDSQWYQKVNGEERKLDLNKKYADAYGFYLTPLGDNQWTMQTYGAETNYLLLCQMKDGQLEVIDELGEKGYLTAVKGSEGGKAIYFVVGSGYDDELGVAVGTLMRYQNGEKERLCKDAYSVGITFDDDTIYVVNPRSEDSWRLLQLRDGQSETIAKDAARYGDYKVCGSNVLYLDNDQNLCVWDGKESRRIARNVLTYWANDDKDVIWLY